MFFILLYGQAQFHRHILFPIFLAKKHSTYIALLLLSTLAVGTMLFALDYYWIAPEIFRDHASIWMGMLYHFVLCIISTFTILSLFLVKQYSKELQGRNEAQLLLSQMNLKFLHAQLNPHFFFNMFNNLYGVSLTYPKRTPSLILKLSELMRYQLESGNKEFVAIADELKFIDNYIAMEQERVGKRCEIKYKVAENVHKIAAYQLPPLILITLVENAFKHSVTISREWFVRIGLAIHNDILVITISNSLPDEQLSSKSTGIGLQNISERMKMLYTGSYELVTAVEAESFQVILKIKLSALKHG
ncbi:MAG: histidine kinase [Mucilaginibacter sp.]